MKSVFCFAGSLGGLLHEINCCPKNHVNPQVTGGLFEDPKENLQKIESHTSFLEGPMILTVVNIWLFKMFYQERKLQKYQVISWYFIQIIVDPIWCALYFSNGWTKKNTNDRILLDCFCFTGFLGLQVLYPPRNPPMLFFFWGNMEQFEFFNSGSLYSNPKKDLFNIAPGRLLCFSLNQFCGASPLWHRFFGNDAWIYMPKHSECMIFNYICRKFKIHVGKYSIHGAFGMEMKL